MTRKQTPLILGIALGCFATTAFGADTVFRPRLGTTTDRAGEGRCIIRVWIDDEADVELRGDQVRIRTRSGQPGRDDGSECSSPLPFGGIQSFNFRGIDGRGEVNLVQQPGPQNRYTAVVNIRDRKGGGEGYTYELRWVSDGRGGYSDGRWDDRDRRPDDRGRYNNGRYNDRFGNRDGVFGNFRGMNETRGGNGYIRQGSFNDSIRRARVNLSPNGDAEIQLMGGEAVTLHGQWSNPRNDSVDVDIRNGWSGATGRGRIYFSRNGQLDRLEITGRSSRRSEPFEVRFDAR